MLGHPPGRLKIAATYKISQPVENFSLRLKIIQQKSLLADLFETEGETRDTNYLVTEERVINWQEKIFSPRETKFYADEKNCITDLHKEYRERIVGREEDGESRLYTYTSKDHYYPDGTILTKDYATPLSRRNGRALPIVKNRKPFIDRYNKKVIETADADSRVRDNHYSYRDRESMYVLVDLSSKDEIASNSDTPPADHQILLCTIIHDRAADTLTIDPDFTDDESYMLEATGLFYDYWIEHASRQPDAEESKQQLRSLQQEVREKRDFQGSEIFQEIVLPLANILRLIVNMEIVSARDFQYDPLFVSYHVDLPKHWTTGESEHLTGRTQRSRMIEKSAHFSYVSEIPLDFDLNSLNDANVQPTWPCFIFTVGSIDNWTRYRIEGYASLPLPPTSGTRNYDLPTWRPIGGFVNVLRRFFTGGTAEIEDVTYCGIPDPRDSTRLEKTRLKVAPGGSIKINLNIVQQSRIFMKNRSLNRDVNERLETAAIINSLDNVLEQFKAARERMIRAIAQ